MNFLPWSHVPNGVPLCYGVSGYTAPININPSFNTCSTPIAKLQDSPAVKALRAGWLKKKAEISAGKYHIPDAEDPDTVSHYDWYEATGFIGFRSPERRRFVRRANSTRLHLPNPTRTTKTHSIYNDPLSDRSERGSFVDASNTHVGHNMHRMHCHLAL